MTEYWLQYPGMVSKGEQHNKMNMDSKNDNPEKYKWGICYTLWGGIKMYKIQL